MEESKKDKATVLGDFKLKKKLGQGGMGTVYLGHQISLDRPCAVKVLSKELAAKPAFVTRFLREARAMAKIDHPNVVTCYAVGDSGGHHFVAMELMNGQSMQDWLNELGKIPIPDALLVTIVCGEALQYAHSINMIHRDIKPDNILVTHKGVIKVADMGLAKAIDDEDMSLTQSGTGLGTPHYMPPEQARNAKHVDNRCDIYALSCTLFHFLTGKTPFEGDSILELITNKEKGKYTTAKRLNSEIPEKLDMMISKAMAANPAHRYQTCGEFVADLESLGLASEALSFIDEEKRTVVRRSASSSSTIVGGKMGSTRGPQNMVKPSSNKPASKSSPQLNTTSEWYIRYEGSDGKVQVGKMSAPQVTQAIKTDKFNAKTQAAVSSKGPFLPLTQVPVFEDEARKMLTRQQASSRNNNLASEYAKLAKQYDRRGWKRFFWNLTNGTLGFVGLLIWIALVIGVGVGLFFIVPILYEMLAGNIGLNNSTP